MNRDRYIISIAIATVLLPLAVFAWSQWRQVSDLRDALAVSRRTIAEQGKTIDQQERIIEAWVNEHPPTDDVEPKMGARILPTVRSLADEAHQATIESRAILRKVDKLITDIEAGAVGVEIDGSIMRGHAEAKLKRN